MAFALAVLVAATLWVPMRRTCVWRGFRFEAGSRLWGEPAIRWGPLFRIWQPQREVHVFRSPATSFGLCNLVDEFGRPVPRPYGEEVETTHYRIARRWLAGQLGVTALLLILSAGALRIHRWRSRRPATGPTGAMGSEVA